MDVNKSISDTTTQSSPITSSTESETFETWTLVTPELTNKSIGKQSNVHETKVSDFGNDRHIEILKRDDPHTDGEMSDGISIISDSESGGRASPQPTPRLFQPLKSERSGSKTPRNSISENELEDSVIKSVKKRYEPITPPSTPEAIDLIANPIREEAMLQQNNEQNLDAVVDEPFALQLRWNSITSISKAFYLAAIVSIIAIFGCMRTPPLETVEKSTGDLNAIYSKLNDILAATGRLEELVHATTNGMDDHGISQYTDVLMTVRELNAKFEANSRALRDVIERIDDREKCTSSTNEPEDLLQNLKELKEHENEVKQKYQREKNGDEFKSNYEKRPPPLSQDKRKESNSAEQRERSKRNGIKQESGEPQRQQHHHKGVYDERQKSHRYESNEKPRKNNNNYREKSNSREEQNDKPYKKDYRKDDYKRREEDSYKKKFDESNDNSDGWMERRSRYREDARKNPDAKARTAEENPNWYLERGDGRQKARKYENVEEGS